MQLNMPPPMVHVARSAGAAICGRGALPGGRVQRIGNRIAKIRVALGQVQFVMVVLKIELQAVRRVGGGGGAWPLLHIGARALGKGI